MTDTNPQSRKLSPAAEENLASELDDLLRGIAGDGQAFTVSPGESVQGSSIDDLPDLEGDFATTAQTLAEKDDALADQIQEMLNEAKAAQVAASSPAPASDDVSIDQLDHMLAAEVPDTEELEGGFESFEEVVRHDVAAEDAPRQDPVAIEARHDQSEVSSDDFASPDEVHTEAAAQEGAPNLAGDFASADDVAEEAVAAPVMAKQTKAPAKAPKAPPKVTEPVPAEAPGPDGYARVEIASDQVRRLCALVNRPLGRISPQARNTLGYIGLGTLAQASVMLIYALVT